MTLPEQWKHLADSLGLSFKPGLDAFLESNVLQALQRAQMAPEIQTALQNSFIRGLFEKLIVGIATGKFKDYEVFLFPGVKSRAKNSTTHDVRFLLAFNRHPPFSFEVSLSGFFERFWTSIFPGNRVLLGNQELDQTLMIRSSEPALTRKILDHLETQDLMVRFFKAYPTAHFSENGLKFSIPGEIVPVEKAQSCLQTLVQVASFLESRF